jgi:hypothetical protein
MDNPLDDYYADGITKLISFIGKKAAFEILVKEGLNRLEVMQKQVVSIEGAFARDIADFFNEYPDWTIKFNQSEAGFILQTRRHIKDKMTDEEMSAKVQEIETRFRELFQKHNKLESATMDIFSTYENNLVDDTEE